MTELFQVRDSELRRTNTLEISKSSDQSQWCVCVVGVHNHVSQYRFYGKLIRFFTHHCIERDPTTDLILPSEIELRRQHIWRNYSGYDCRVLKQLPNAVEARVFERQYDRGPY